MQLTVYHTCGHVRLHDIDGTRSERRREFLKHSRWVCPECYAAAMAPVMEEIEAKLDLCDLVGSEKQVAWARRIRYRAMRDAAGYSRLQECPHRDVVIGRLSAETASGFWIGKRDINGADLYNLERSQVEQETV